MSRNDPDSFDSLDSAASHAPASSGGVTPCSGRKALRIVPRDAAFAALKTKKYRLVVGGETFQGTSGEDGLIKQIVPGDAKSATLVVWPEEREGTAPLKWELDLGTMPPATTTAGVQSRLANLGFDCRVVGSVDGATTTAVEAFQDLVQLEINGLPDATTQQRVDQVYSSADPIGGGVMWNADDDWDVALSESRAADAPVDGVGDE